MVVRLVFVDDARARNLYGLNVRANACWLYLRLAVETASDLLATRFLLSSLGVEGYGIFSAAAASIGAWGFFSGALEAAARRFVCFDSRNFAPLLGLVLLLTALLGVLGGIGTVLVSTYAFSVACPLFICVLVRLLRIPYDACIVASEKMGFSLVLSIAESLLALASAVGVRYLSGTPLDTYAMLRLAMAVLSAALVMAFSAHRNVLARLRPCFDFTAMKPLAGYFGWHALGSVAGLLKANGIVILLAAYAGMSACAAYESAAKVGAVLWGLIAYYRTAYLPGIVKAWADQDVGAFVAATARTFQLSIAGMTPLAALIVWFAPEICPAWFGADLADGTAMFVRMISLQFYFEALATPLDTAVRATGRIAEYEIILMVLLGSSFFLAWLFLAAGLSAWTSIGAVAIANIFAFLYRFAHLRIFYGIAIRAWFSRCAL